LGMLAYLNTRADPNGKSVILVLWESWWGIFAN
jgi:hypothetical protein